MELSKCYWDARIVKSGVTRTGEEGYLHRPALQIILQYSGLVGSGQNCQLRGGMHLPDSKTWRMLSPLHHSLPSSQLLFIVKDLRIWWFMERFGNPGISVVISDHCLIYFLPTDQTTRQPPTGRAKHRCLVGWDGRYVDVGVISFLISLQFCIAHWRTAWSAMTRMQDLFSCTWPKSFFNISSCWTHFFRLCFSHAGSLCICEVQASLDAERFG